MTFVSLDTKSVPGNLIRASHGVGSLFTLAFISSYAKLMLMKMLCCG